MKRSCPSLMRVARSNIRRQVLGLKNGSRPSATNISAKAPSRTSPTAVGAGYFFAAGAGAAPPLPRMARKKSLLGSSTITSLLVRKLAR